MKRCVLSSSLAPEGFIHQYTRTRAWCQQRRQFLFVTLGNTIACLLQPTNERAVFPTRTFLIIMLRSFLLAVLCVFLAGSTVAFSPAVNSAVSLSSTTSSTSLNVFGNKKSAAAKAAQAEKDAEFWQGEWVCKDCGYIYNKVRTSLSVIQLNRLAAFAWFASPNCIICAFFDNPQAECAGMYFEEQGPGFRCPQCSGPRRRYAKKVGDRVGTTLDGGDAPILIFSFGGVIATIIFGFWAVNNL
jgi:rubredoxin